MSFCKASQLKVVGSIPAVMQAYFSASPERTLFQKILYKFYTKLLSSLILITVVLYGIIYDRATQIYSLQFQNLNLKNEVFNIVLHIIGIPYLIKQKKQQHSPRLKKL